MQVRFSIFYGSSLEYESEMFEITASDDFLSDAIRAKASSHAESWLMQNSSYPLDEWGYSLNFFNSPCKEAMDVQPPLFL